MEILWGRTLVRVTGFEGPMAKVMSVSLLPESTYFLLFIIAAIALSLVSFSGPLR